MLSYRHSFHAGNYADVLKHMVQVAILEYLSLKDKPFCVVDTHAGAGAYTLASEHAQKTLEYRDGIERLWDLDKKDDLLANTTVARYLELVKEFNRDDNLSTYPGSPWFSRQYIRQQDKLFLHEIHPTDFDLLSDFFDRDRKVKLFKQDGFVNGLGLLPPLQKRALVLIDPPYEMKEDYQRVVTFLTKAHKKFANGIYALWYPVVDRDRIDLLKQSLVDSGIKRIHCYELANTADSDEFGMTASGMIVINPPWTLKSQMDEVLPKLCPLLSKDSGSFYRSEEWVGE